MPVVGPGLFAHMNPHKSHGGGLIIPHADEKTGLRGLGYLRKFLQLLSGRAGD